ncbi:MAG: alpha-glucuronidase, partial [Eggerthellaceae bacterium]|nr:alpha-glucuronidase [Eggerthellaceae bacterium]
SKVKISSNSQVGVLYGTYAYMRQDKTGQLGSAVLTKNPTYNDRILDHWDNPNGTVERGYAGSSLWKWEELPDITRPEYEEYARVNAAVGINGAVLNNVKADVCMLTSEYLQKVKVLFDMFHPYGIKVYLSINFAEPKHIGGVSTPDPLDPQVISFWNNKAAEIYSYVPDFGGFLVKTNSEGQLGPQDYGRTHADGTNMLADALKPYGSIVMWCVFVYLPKSEDRVMQAVEEFQPFDGQFRDNVSIQIKNGLLYFQPREPFIPLFGCMNSVNIMLEFQITQEYLGNSIYLAYLHIMWKECLDSDTYQYGHGSMVSSIAQGKLRPISISAIAGVINIGDDRNWCGRDLAQANRYAYGYMAWNTNASSQKIAEEFLKLAFSDNPEFVSKIGQMMLDSRETVV